MNFVPRGITVNFLWAAFLLLRLYYIANASNDLDDKHSEQEISTYMDEFSSYMSDHTFRIVVPAGSRECFYQNVTNGTHIFNNFEVLAGQDRNIDYYVRNSLQENIYLVEWDNKGETEFINNKTDILSFCMDNMRGRFSSKNVVFQLLAFKPFPRKATNETTSKADNNGTNDANLAPETEPVIEGRVWHSLLQVDEFLFKVAEFQATSRTHKAVDLSLQEENANYVQFRALFLITVILLVATCQVLFVRRLFMMPQLTSTNKPRA